MTSTKLSVPVCCKFCKKKKKNKKSSDFKKYNIGHYWTIL